MSSSNTASSHAQLFTEVSLDDMCISRPIASTSGGRGQTSSNMYIGAGGRKPFAFQMSRAGAAHRNTLVFAPDAPTNGSTRVNLALSIPRGDEDVMAFWAALDDRVIKHTAIHSKEFLKRTMTEEEVRSIYTPTVRVKEGFENYIKVRFDIAADARCGVKMFDVNEQHKRYSPLHHSRLDQGDSVTCITQAGLVYFFNQKVGITIDVSHLTRYAPPPANDFPFQLGAEYSACAPDDLFKAPETAEATPSTAPLHDHVDVDENDDDDDVEDDEEEKTPAPAVVAADGSSVTLDPVTMYIIPNTGHGAKRDATYATATNPRASKRTA
jgi:hypothetical protein